MAHAEKCPVCNSNGKMNGKACHGCNGKGWIEVGDDHPTMPWPYVPTWPYAPTRPYITWSSSSEAGL